MTVLQEGSIKLTLPDGVQARNFDDPSHGLSHCMKAVDFIVETPDKMLFIEFKDPDCPYAQAKDRERFLKELLAGQKDDELIRKYRDSFIYLWAEGLIEELDKPIFYYVLIAANRLDEAMLLTRTEALKRNLPVKGPTNWKRQITTGCIVFNLKTWNQYLPQYPVTRITL